MNRIMVFSLNKTEHCQQYRKKFKTTIKIPMSPPIKWVPKRSLFLSGVPIPEKNGSLKALNLRKIGSLSGPY